MVEDTPRRGTSVESLFARSSKRGGDRNKLRKAIKLASSGHGVEFADGGKNTEKNSKVLRKLATGTSSAPMFDNTVCSGSEVESSNNYHSVQKNNEATFSSEVFDPSRSSFVLEGGSRLTTRCDRFKSNKPSVQAFNFKPPKKKAPAKTTEFSWILQKSPRELFLSKEGARPARDITYRSSAHFKREVNRHTRALASTNMTTSELFKCYFCRGFANARLDKNEQAHADYTEALKLDSKNGASLFNRSQVLVKLGQFDNAIKDLTKAIAVDPSHSSDCYHNRALIHRKLGCFGKAMNDYEKRDNFQKISRQLEAFEEQQQLFQQPSYPYGPNSVNSPKGAVDVEKLVRQQQQRQKIEKLTQHREQPRSASEFSQISILNGDGRLGSFGRVLQIPPSERTQDHITDITDRVCLLSCLKMVPRPILERLALFATYQLTKKDMFVFEEGDYGNSVYVVLSGHVSVRCKPPNATGSAFSESLNELINGISDTLRNEDIIKAKLYPGMSFGELGDEVMNQAKQDEKNAAQAQSQSQAKTAEVVDPKKQSTAQTTESQSKSQGETQPFDSRNKSAPTSTPTKKVGRRRRASIRAEEDTEFLNFKVTPDSIGVLREYRQWQVEDRMKTIQKSIIFQNWSKEAVEKLAKVSMEVIYAPGTELIKQGDQQVSMFLLRQGTCSVTKCVDVSQAAKSQEDENHPLKSREYSHVLFEIEVGSDYNNKRRAKTGDLKEFEVGMITGGQVAAEFTILENGKSIASPVTVRAVTTVSTLVVSKENLAGVISYFYGESMARVRQSLHLNSTFDAKAIATMYAKNKGWKEAKKNIVLDNLKMSNKLWRAQQDAQRNEEDTT